MQLSTELYDELSKTTKKGEEVLPKGEYLLQLLQLPITHFEDPKNAKDKRILLWYQDRWMPIVVGLEYWDNKYRHYELPTDKVKLRDGNEWVHVTISSEAFGLAMYENCRDKWEEIMKLKAENRGKCNVYF